MLYGKKGGHLLVMPPTLPTMASTILFVIDCPKSVIEQDGSAGPWSAGWAGGLIENYLIDIRTSLFQLYVIIKQVFTSRGLASSSATTLQKES